jgi:hypothetical protein
MRRLRRIFLSLVLAVMASGSFASAEPIVITSGRIILPQDIFDPAQPTTVLINEGKVNTGQMSRPPFDDCGGLHGVRRTGPPISAIVKRGELVGGGWCRRWESNPHGE